MTRSTGQRRYHFKNKTPNDPAITPFAQWSSANQTFFKEFRVWLERSGYSPSAVDQYAVAARSAIGYLNKPHETIHPTMDLERVRLHFIQRDLSLHMRQEYDKGLLRLADFLGESKPVAARRVNWEYHLHGLPDGFCEHVREFLAAVRHVSADDSWEKITAR